MRIVIAGAGEVGTHLAKMLSNEEQNIVLMDQDGKKLERASHHWRSYLSRGVLPYSLISSVLM